MASTFFERIDHLAERVGHGKVAAEVKVDQRYAAFQHFRRELRHPRGGQAYYLEEPLASQVVRWGQMWADSLLDEGGPARGTREIGEAVAAFVPELAPLDVGDLRMSASVQVIDNGVLSYDRPPARARLTDAELRAKVVRRRRR